jgi:cytochrome bd ubiquinol oxidase subunit I
LTALLQTAWYRSGRDEYLRLTRFFGTLLVINVAIGVVTGLVQEFQFGMDWGAYSRLVGSVFGAPLAIEGLAAFFLESTFLGLGLFGRDKLPRRAHLLTIVVVSLGTVLSAAFIMTANSWMQHPVGLHDGPRQAAAAREGVQVRQVAGPAQRAYMILCSAARTGPDY